MDDLARIEKMMRIEGVLDLAKSVVNGVAEHLAIPFAAREPVAVLTGKAAAEFEYQVGDVFGDAPHARQVGRLLDVQHGPNVQTTDTGVAVKRAVRAVLLQDGAKAGDKARQILRRDRGVFDKRHRLAIARDAE